MEGSNTGCMFCRVNIGFSGHFHCDTIFGKVVSLLNEPSHSFHNIRYGSEEAGFRIVKFGEFESFVPKNTIFTLGNN